MSGEQIVDIDVSKELSSSFLEYSMSVIVARALPDVRDGLKPVHRRILWSMHQQGIRPGTPYKKCARVVGDVIGRYHPHGDSAVYEALVRLAQPWSMRVPVIDGHGNFGSLDDGPAAMRYTECRLDSAASSLVGELNENTVDMRPNYDGTESEPVVMPAAFPNLLVNGTTGIAVGMATNMPPHNLIEVISGLRALLENPELSGEDLMGFIPGPDLPTGGSIVGLDGLRDAYLTGRGTFRMRATVEVQDVSARRKGLVVTELPYNVGPEKVVARVKELVSAKKIVGISDVKDYSDRKTGLRLVIEVKSGFDPHALLDQLYRLTPLEESFGVNNVALVDGQPRTLTLREMCQYFVEHRRVVVRRRTQFRLDKAEARAHIVEGLVLALASIDEVVAVIRSSKDSAAARAKLVKTFSLSQIQAEAILEMTLRRLTSLEVNKLKQELKELKEAIRGFRAILDSADLLTQVVSQELEEVGLALGSPRRTRLLSSVPESSRVSASLEVPDDPAVVVLTSQGLMGRLPAAAHAGRVTKADVLALQVPTSNRSEVGVVTSTGRLLRVPAMEFPVLSAQARGVRAEDALDLQDSERVVGLFDARPGHVVGLVTARGLVKRVRTDDFPKSSAPRPIMAVSEGDEVILAVSSPAETADGLDFVLVSSHGQLLRFSSSSASPKGLGAGGMSGMKLPESEVVVCAAMVDPAAEVEVVTVSDANAVKRSLLSEYPAKGRGTGGVRAMSFRRSESRVDRAMVAVGPVYAVSASGAASPVGCDLARRDASGAPWDSPVQALASVSRGVPAS